MKKRSLRVIGLLICSTSACVLLAQSAPPSTSFPHKEIILAESSFIDIGPPFDFYSLYTLTSTASGTDIEKIAITPPGDACTQPATTEVSHAHLEQSLSDLFDHKDPCTIPEKELHREAKRCKHCAVFSGVHVVAQLQCDGKPRNIRYEVLDRDIFDSRTNTPTGTSRTMKLLSTLNDAFGGGDMDRPIFAVLPPSATAKQPPANTPTLQDIANGKYDSLFSEPISKLYKDSQLPPKFPIVSLKTSSPSAPLSPTMPIYPPIGRAAHIQGDVSLQLQIGPDGKVAEAKAQSGPLMLQGATLQAAKDWSFPPEAANQTQSVTIHFDMNCANISTSTSHEAQSLPPPLPAAH